MKQSGPACFVVKLPIALRRGSSDVTKVCLTATATQEKYNHDGWKHIALLLLVYDEFLQISQESIKEIIKTEHTKSKTNKTMANRGGRAAPAGGGKICQFKLVLLGTPRLQDYGHTTSCFRCSPPLLFSSSLLFLRPIILRRSVYGY